MKSNYTFSEITVTGEIPDEMNDKAILAACLNDWGCVYAGAEPPKNFGIGIAKASHRLGIVGTPENFKKLAKELEK